MGAGDSSKSSKQLADCQQRFAVQSISKLRITNVAVSVEMLLTADMADDHATEDEAAGKFRKLK